MTFSQQVKDELLVQDIDEKTAKIELMAVFKAIGTIQFNNSGLQIELETSQIKLTKRILTILRREYKNVEVQTLVRQTRRFKESTRTYILRISSMCREILFDLNFIDDVNVGFIYELKDVTKHLKTEDEKQVYTRTYFCCTGSVNDPKVAKQYHLEIISTNRDYLEGIKNIVAKFSINMKISKRKSNYALYLNKSEEIADFLKFIKSFDMLFVFENYRMTRDIILVNNRLNNADIANEVKRLNSSMQQIDAINYLMETGILHTLKPRTIEIARLRIENPDDSLLELANRTRGTVSKANISYHLKQLVTLANKNRAK